MAYRSWKSVSSVSNIIFKDKFRLDVVVADILLLLIQDLHWKPEQNI